MTRLALAVLPLLLLSGCFVEKDADLESVSQAIETGFASVGANATRSGSLPVLADLLLNATGLDAVFTFTADDADNGTVAWAMDFGDNGTANGTMMRVAEVDESIRPTGNVTLFATVSHTYANPGAYNVTLTLTDASGSVLRTLVADVGQVAAPTQDPLRFEGSVTCLPTTLLDGEISGGSHTFDVLAGQTQMVLTLLYSDGPVEDLDIVATSPSGTEHESAASGPEPPMTIESPEEGTWELRIIGYSCAGSNDYTVDAVFG